jgi:phytoene dehydrogenase-like protein
MVRYDAAIIGAGSNGLAACAALAGAGLKTIVVERADRAGGRCVTREFHPGFRASPFCDEIAPIPAEIFRTLDLARHGAIFTPASAAPRPGVIARAAAEAARAPERGWFAQAPVPMPWPGQDASHRALADMLDDDGGAIARALSGRAADPSLSGTALHALAPGIGGSGMTMGGLATLGGALERSARAAGAEFSLGLEVADIRLGRGRAAGLRLADGTEIEARAVISTLDLKRSFFSLFAWKDLPKSVTGRVSSYRSAAAAARLLIALEAPPAGMGAAPIFLNGDHAKAFAAWQARTAPEHPPLTLRLVSAADPRLAPPGQATLTATIGAVPHHLFDGPWTNEKRNALRGRVLADIAAAFPGMRVLGQELILPPDIEEQLGVTEGDLDGGELAPDQMFALRGFAEHPGGRTPIDGLYLGGRSSPLGPFASCAAGVAAARALMADLA